MLQSCDFPLNKGLNYFHNKIKKIITVHNHYTAVFLTFSPNQGPHFVDQCSDRNLRLCIVSAEERPAGAAGAGSGQGQTGSGAAAGVEAGAAADQRCPGAVQDGVYECEEVGAAPSVSTRT